MWTKAGAANARAFAVMVGPNVGQWIFTFEFADLAAFGAPDPQLDAPDVRPIAHPYLGWTDTWTQELVAEAVAWERGPETRSTIDLWVFGGSVAAGFGNLGAVELGDQLARTPAAAGRRVRVWNFGRASWREPQPQFLLEWLLQSGARPDVVLVLHGFNEIVHAAEHGSAGTHPLYPSPSYWTWMTRSRGSDLAALEELGAVHAAQKELRSAAALASDMGWHHSAFLTRIGLVETRPDVDRAFDFTLRG